MFSFFKRTYDGFSEGLSNFWKTELVGLADRIDYIINKVDKIEERLDKMALDLEGLVFEVNKAQTVQASAVLLIQQLIAELHANVDNPEAIKALADNLKASSDALAAAVAAVPAEMTDGKPGFEPAPAPAPVEEVKVEEPPVLVIIESGVEPVEVSLPAEMPQVASVEIVVTPEGEPNKVIVSDATVEVKDDVVLEAVKTEAGSADVVVAMDATTVEVATVVDVVPEVQAAADAAMKTEEAAPAVEPTA